MRLNKGRLTRRRFIGVAGLTCVSSVRLNEAKSDEELSTKERRFELGTVTYNLARDWDLEQLIENCEAADFRGVELRTTHQHGVEPDISDQERTQVRRRFERTPVTLVALGTACEYHSPDQDELERNINLTGRFLELAADVGARGIKVRPNGIPDGVPEETTLKQIGRSLADLGEIATKYKVEIWVEVHGRKSSHPPLMKKMMEYCGHPMVGVNWNCNKTDLKEGEIRPYFELLQPYISHVHINRLTSGYPYRELFSLLRQMDYEGYTMSEIPAVKGDPIRFMNYYRALWDELSRAPS